MSRSWICCQLGAREHYALPRQLYKQGQLACLLTDAWVSSRSAHLLSKYPFSRQLSERFHPELERAHIQAFTTSAIQFELRQRLRQASGWQLTILRNQWFQSKALSTLHRLTQSGQFSSHAPILFAYSYAALELFRYAKAQGWTTILGQIDPGPLEEEIVQKEHLCYPMLAPTWQPAPEHYWQTWYQECELADHIIVNSHWSERALQTKGVGIDKTMIIPLSYSPPAAAKAFKRVYPKKFSAERPLRVLFLGQVILRKGIAKVLETMPDLVGKPIELWIVGKVEIKIPTQFQQHPQIRWIESVPRSQVDYYYQLADVFLFPTLSDGFGLTQLEAQAWQLPIIISEFCGMVIDDETYPLRLKSVTSYNISQALCWCLDNIEALEKLVKTSVFSRSLLLPNYL
jgi:glycosyltransferase involved in cell wall biosynthesis